MEKLADFDKVYVIKYYKFNTNAFNNKTVFLQEAEKEYFERALRAYVNRGAHEPGTNTCVVVESGVTWTMYLDDNDFPNTIYPKTGIIQSKKARDKKDDNKGTR